MDDFNVVIDDKECSCTKCDKVYLELNNSTARDDLDYMGLNNLIESINIPIESISCMMRIKKKSPNYKRMRKFFKKLFKELN